MKNLTQLFLIFLLNSQFAWGIESSSAKEIAAKFIPSRFVQDATGLKDPSDSELIYYGAIPNWVDLDGNGLKKYLLVGYHAMGGQGSASLICELRVIKVEGTNYTLMDPTVIQFSDEILGCNQFEVRNLDNDRKAEVIVYSIRGKEDGIAAIFKWDGSKLVSITPTNVHQGQVFNSLDRILISTEKIAGEYLIVSHSPSDPSEPKKSYVMKDGKIILKETHAWSAYLTNEKSQKVFNPKLKTEGAYFLEVKNISEHKRPIRAEVVVNGVTVLAPKDFCHSVPLKVVKGKGVEDDDDDQNEDKYKRCPAKNGIVYAEVDIKKPTEVKVKLFGKKNSKVRITLDKK